MALGCPGSRDPALPSVQRTCVCVFAHINQIHNDVHCTYAYMSEYVCMNVCTCMCVYRYVLPLPGFPGPRVSFMVCLHDPEC